MKTIICSAAALLTMTLGLGVVNASGPIGVYALVDRVTFEPNIDHPERDRIYGVFSAAEDTPDNSTVYAAPQRGYLYLALPPGKEDLARREWADLKSIAGTRQVVGLGSSRGVKVHVRQGNENAKAPDDYPIANGLVKINLEQSKAKALLDYKGR